MCNNAIEKYSKTIVVEQGDNPLNGYIYIFLKKDKCLR